MERRTYYNEASIKRRQTAVSRTWPCRERPPQTAVPTALGDDPVSF